MIHKTQEEFLCPLSMYKFSHQSFINYPQVHNYAIINIIHINLLFITSIQMAIFVYTSK